MNELIVFIGDLHGEWRFFHEAKRRFDHALPITFIQVGDLGYWPEIIPQWPVDMPWKVYFIDGNHEYMPLLTGHTEVTELQPNLFFIPRGTQLTIAGKRIGFMGGAESVDKAWRTPGKNWFPEERVSRGDIEKLRGASLDLLVTHAPPIEVIRAHFPPINRIDWGLPLEWEDVSANRIQGLWNSVGRPQLICGHMHRSVIGANYRILDIGEVYGIDKR
jgi:predicted phosphodiesterase